MQTSRVYTEDCFYPKSDLGCVGGNGADVCHVVTFFEGWDCVDVQDDTEDGSAGSRMTLPK
jgi:hypothetical protein